MKISMPKERTSFYFFADKLYKRRMLYPQPNTPLIRYIGELLNFSYWILYESPWEFIRRSI